MFLQLFIGLAFSILGYLLVPKPKQKLPTLDDLKEPTAASKPIQRVFGSVTIESPQVIGKWDKQMSQRRAKKK